MSEQQPAYQQVNRDPDGPEFEESPQVINLRSSTAGVVEADLVRMHQSFAQEITSDEVDLHQSGALDVTTVEVAAHEAAMVMVTAKDVEMTNSGAGAIRAENVNMTGLAGVVLSDTVDFGTTYAGVVAGRQVQAEKIDSLILLARNVDGEVHTLMDTRGALIAGVVAGLFTGVVMLLGRLLLGRKA